MKTIYTDKLGLYPWAMLFVSIVMFGRAYNAFEEGRTLWLCLNIGIGGSCLFLALKRFRDVQQTKREGRDPTILRIKD